MLLKATKEVPVTHAGTVLNLHILPEYARIPLYPPRTLAMYLIHRLRCYLSTYLSYLFVTSCQLIISSYQLIYSYYLIPFNPSACSLPLLTSFTDVAIRTSTFFPFNLTANLTKSCFGFTYPIMFPITGGYGHHSP